MLSTAMALVGCGRAGHRSTPTIVADPPLPPLCEQITDYIDAYIGYVGCRQPRYDLQFGYFPTIAEQTVDGIECSPANSVAGLPYRVERVDTAAREVMREELLGELNLFSAIQAIAMATLPTFATPDGDELARRRAHEALWNNIRSVPALYQPLRSKVAAKLGHVDACEIDQEAPVVVATTLPQILERLTKLEDRDGCVKRGLMNFTAGQHIDPNVAVAIAWLQRGNLAYVPTLEQLEEKLRAMGVTLVEDTLAEH